MNFIDKGASILGVFFLCKTENIEHKNPQIYTDIKPLMSQ